MISASTLSAQLQLYLVLDPDLVAGDPLEAARAAMRGGVTMLQLRAKHRTDREILALAEPLADICRREGVPFLVNDRLDLALACGADGVHLGVDDLPLAHARRLGGSTLIIGYSPESDEQIRAAAENGASYLGIGPVFATSTKGDAGEPLGVAEFARRHQLSGLPAVGIGGISVQNAGKVMEAGADGVAVVSAILAHPHPRQATAELLRVIQRSRS